MALVYDFLSPDRTEVEEQRVISAPGATVGDVLTVGADKTVSPAAGGGSLPQGVPIEYVIPIAFDTPNILTGAVVYTPTPGDRLIAGSGISYPSDVPKWLGTGGKDPALNLGFADQPDAIAQGASVSDLNDADSPYDDNGHLLKFENGGIADVFDPQGATVYFADAEPIRVFLFDDGQGYPSDPEATQGEAEVRLLIWPKGTTP